MPIHHIIFDLDNTLCDYSSARQCALNKCCELLPEKIDPATYLEQYSRLEPRLFQQFTQGELSNEVYRLRRFFDPLESCDIRDESLAERMNALYVKRANEDVQLFPGVEKLLTKIRRNGLRLSLLTNGPGDGQRKKISNLKIGCFFNRICISEEMGYAKPNKKAFMHALQGTPIPAEYTLMVGDSLTMDIKPARELGMQVYHVRGGIIDL